MAIFEDLPLEIHQLIAQCCGDAGHHVLSKFSLLSRYFQSIARPLLTTSADLTLLKDEEQKLQLFSHHFAPPLRTKLVKLSLTLGRSQIFTEYSMEDGLDDIYSNIISLLPLLQTLQFTLSSGLAKDELDKDDFAFTLKAAARLNYLETLTICGDHQASSVPSKVLPRSSQFLEQVLFEYLPKFKALKKLSLTQLAIVLPQNLTEKFPKPEKITLLNLRSVQLLHIASNLIPEDYFYQLINFFSTTLESLIIDDLKMDRPLSPRPIMASRLNHLGLSIASDGTTCGKEFTTNQIEHEGQIYRQILEYFSNTDVESITISEPTGLNQLNFFNNSGGFKNVFRVNQ